MWRRVRDVMLGIDYLHFNEVKGVLDGRSGVVRDALIFLLLTLDYLEVNYESSALPIPVPPTLVAGCSWRYQAG